MKRNPLSSLIRDAVRQRAKGLCEYCHTDETWQYVEFTIDHVIPLSAQGSDGLENLALACFACNRRKSNLLETPDPESGQLTPLFNPCLSLWADHFSWSSDRLKIIGTTATGRATATLLDLNRPRLLKIRAADLQVNRHPPIDDPVLPS